MNIQKKERQMALRALSKERKIEMYLKVLVESSALQLLWGRWSDQSSGSDGDEDWQIRMGVLSHLLEKKLSKKEHLYNALQDDFPEIKELEWIQFEH